MAPMIDEVIEAFKGNEDKQDAERWRKLKRLVDNQKYNSETHVTLWIEEWFSEKMYITAYVEIGDYIHSTFGENNFDSLIDSIPEPTL